jgi:hypothetical protein
MNGMDQLYRWNAWFDEQTPKYRFDLAIWAVVVLGLLNLLLTMAFGMAFGLLLLLGLILANLARLPYALGELPTPAAAGDPVGTVRLQALHRRITEAPDTVVSLPILGVALAAILGMGSIRGHVPTRPRPMPVVQPQQMLAIEDQQQPSRG